MNATNGFETFLKQREELPRLSILENYKEINRIMTNCYMKSFEFEKKYRNSEPTGDEDFNRYKEEEKNSRKMTTILKSLNSPKGKKKVGERSSMFQA